MNPKCFAPVTPEPVVIDFEDGSFLVDALDVPARLFVYPSLGHGVWMLEDGGCLGIVAFGEA